jgi:hypothetical protein
MEGAAMSCEAIQFDAIADFRIDANAGSFDRKAVLKTPQSKRFATASRLRTARSVCPL